jgi:hypothetical protein
VSTDRMPILHAERRYLKTAGLQDVESVPFAPFATDAARARTQRNHGQTPERIRERGGFGIREALAILTGRDYWWARQETTSEDVTELLRLVAERAP